MNPQRLAEAERAADAAWNSELAALQDTVEPWIDDYAELLNAVLLPVVVAAIQHNPEFWETRDGRLICPLPVYDALRKVRQAVMERCQRASERAHEDTLYPL